ncbi:LysR substrate-binding domain-containing protein [Paracoccus sp. Z330]|uniref:LysR substrate-binding domain-containing protein n=1 Tax=Paracoccus onchidii TaxID=3017813 RepID=A0ABT4ZDV4_9RHOB|nr:LysR substrate-binding domain-containing protein [Paracoccus onchidii]MDB6177173.1 LysR substrate-binding domain-containing protein [Paracoccus onchidii]
MTKTTGLPPLNALRAFEMSGRHLNFRAAAEELGVTQGAIAQQVRGLEDRLGMRLFQRRSKGLAFTAVGRRYHQQVSRAFDILVSATDELRPRRAVVTISVTPTLASKWLIPALPKFTREHPDIEMRILATEAISSFHADGIDLAIRQGQPPFGASLDPHLLFAQDVVAVASPNLVQGRELPLTARQFEDFTLLHDAHDLWPEFARRVLGNAALSAPAMRLSQTSLAIDAALAGQGIALAAHFMVRADVEAGRLVQVHDSALRGAGDFYLLSRRSAKGGEPVEAVIGWLLAQR